MLNENMAGGGHVAGTSGGIVSSSSGVSINKTPVPIPSSGLTKTTIAPSAASALKVSNSGLQKSTVVPQSSSTVIDPAFLADHVKPGSGDLWLTKEDYAKLSPAEQQAYNTGGYSALQSYWTANNIATASQSAADQAQFDATYQTPGAGDQYITKADYKNLSSAEQKAYDTGGYAALQSYWTVQTTTYNDSPDVKSAKQRITDLQQDITNAQNDIANNQNPWDDPASNPALQQEIQTDTAIINILQSYINAQQPIPTNITTIASAKMIPYVTANPDGTLNIDVTHAASIGVDPATLKAAGATDGQISTGQALHDLALYAVSGGGIDIDRAVAAGVPDATLKAAGFQDSDIAAAKSVSATMATLAKSYKSGDGYLVAQAVADGAITQDQAAAAGFIVSKSDVASSLKDLNGWGQIVLIATLYVFLIATTIKQFIDNGWFDKWLKPKD